MQINKICADYMFSGSFECIDIPFGFLHPLL